MAELWLSSAHRSLIALAARLIDVELATDPDVKGEAVAEGLRTLVTSPLRVFFVVREADRIVEVIRARRI